MDFDSLGLGARLGVVFGGIFVSAVVLSSVASDWSKAQSASSQASSVTLEAIVQAQPPAAGPAAGPAAASATPEAASAAPSASENAQRELKYLVSAWRNAWASRDVAAYLAFYSPEFQGNTDSPEHWRANRQRIIGQAKSIDIQIGQIDIILDGDDLATITFPLDYASDRLKDHGTKMLQLRRDNGKWLIDNETFAAK